MSTCCTTGMSPASAAGQGGSRAGARKQRARLPRCVSWPEASAKRCIVRENRDRGRVAVREQGFCVIRVLAGDGPPAPKHDPQLGFRAQPRGEGLPHEQ
eukprot:222562-Chlamydomonas_euryale.AAC.1